MDVMKSVVLDTNEIVYDEKGNALRYYQSQKLLNTGEYTMRLDGPLGEPGSKKYLQKLTVAQQISAYERMKKFMDIPGSYLNEGKQLDIKPLTLTVDQQDLDQKVVILIFWLADCPPCTESFDALNDFFAQIHNPERIVILAITNDDLAIAAAKLKQKPLAYARLLSNAGSITSAYDLKAYPAFVVTDRNHIIRFAAKGIGPVSLAAFKNAIRTVVYQ